MYKEILQSVEGINIYPIISLIVFIGFFISVLIYVIKIDNKFIKKMENLPLESDIKTSKNFTGVNDEN